MNVVNTRTNILIFMVVTQEPTIGKCQLLLMTCYSCLPHILETFIIKNTSSIKAKVRMPKVLQKIQAWLHEDMQQVKLGGMLGLRNVVFSSTFPFTIPYISSPY